MQKYIMETANSPHMGKMIEKYITDRFISRADLARRLGITQQAVGSIIGQPSLRLTKLWTVSVALNHDFFADLSNLLPENIEVSPENARQQRIADLEKQVEKLTMQVEIYEKALRIK